jgi:mannose-6-phosphate isomerase-like protein (cupin superfamily)
MSAINSVRRSPHCFVAPVLISWLCLIGTSSGQTPTPRPRVSPPSTTVFLHVRDTSARPLAGVRVLVDGTTSGEFTTDGEGVVRLQSMRDGPYHLRFEKEEFVAQERDLTLRRGEPDVIEVALAAAPPPPAPPPLPPPAPPAAASTPAVTSPPPAAGDQRTVSIQTFLDRNFIGREPMKESILGCTPSATTRLLQLRDGLAEHVHGDIDETLYVVAGEGALLVPGHPASQVAPGSLSIVPRGAPHALERRGKNPLIVLSILSGAPCTSETGAPK